MGEIRGGGIACERDEDLPVLNSRAGKIVQQWRPSQALWDSKLLEGGQESVNTYGSAALNLQAATVHKGDYIHFMQIPAVVSAVGPLTSPVGLWTGSCRPS
mmetsp:Transcript_2043/g.6055  ORF Transcript_2043/g.6055 Transcript_2043/m.6055 type:complete len:101 (+) Transcript_2043:4303-4605(+)